MRRAWGAVIAVICAGCGRLAFDEHDRPDAAAEADALVIEGADAPAGYRASAVRFDTSGNDFMWAGSLLNTVSSGSGTFSAWFHFNGGDDQQQLIAVTQIIGFGGVLRTAQNRFRFVMQNCVGFPVVDMQSNGAYTTASGWVHVLAAWDSSAGRADLYINDISDRATPTVTVGPICYDTVRWGISGWTSGGLDADVADFYAALGTYLDLDVEANRRKFRDAAGKPVDLGTDCSGPTGSLPTGCFTGAPATWSTNKGAAAGFNLEGDGLAPAATSPSD